MHPRHDGRPRSDSARVPAALRRMVTGVVCSDAWREALPAVAHVGLASLQQVAERWWGPL